MKTSCIRPLALAGALLCASAPALAEDVFVRLKPFEEVPALSSTATGTFFARIDTTAGTIAYQLTYSGLQSGVTQAHIHVGQRSVNGGISVFLCSNLGNGPAGTQACPTPGGTITGLLLSSNVIGPSGQGISPGEFDELVRAIRNGVAYANVHSNAFPGGEVRGQLNELRNVLSF